MNAPHISEHDLELLETYLDNELPDPEADALRARLNCEPALAAAMDQIQQQRELRHQAFFAMEREIVAATQPTGDAVARSLRHAAVREVAWSGRLRVLRQVGAAAACLFVGVMVGWYGRSQKVDPRAPGPRVVNNDVVTPINNAKAQRNGTGFNVAITDDFGRVIAEQHFNTEIEALKFSNDIVRWQDRQRQVRNGDVRLISGGF